eukprot:68874-Chlamydomonas_euryale.AAC.7
MKQQHMQWRPQPLAEPPMQPPMQPLTPVQTEPLQQASPEQHAFKRRPGSTSSRGRAHCRHTRQPTSSRA